MHSRDFFSLYDLCDLCGSTRIFGFIRFGSETVTLASPGLERWEVERLRPANLRSLLGSSPFPELPFSRNT
jgi:hypothetical protein